MPGCCPTVLRSHILLAHALWRGRFVFARVGLHLLWACLLAGGLVFAFGVCSLGVFACLLVCARLGVVGQCGPAAPFAPLACLRAHALVWACWRVRGSACPMGGGRPSRGGTIVSRPFTCVGGAVHRPMRGEEGEKGWG